MRCSIGRCGRRRGPLIFGIDETLERRRGAKIKARAISPALVTYGDGGVPGTPTPAGSMFVPGVVQEAGMQALGHAGRRRVPAVR